MQVRPPASQREWLRLLVAEPWFGDLQARTRRALRRLIRKLAAHANWTTVETWPTWDALIAASGWSRTRMSTWLRQLKVLGWLVTVEQGSTPQFRPMALAHEVKGNRAAVYQLTVPLRPQDIPTIPDTAAELLTAAGSSEHAPVEASPEPTARAVEGPQSQRAVDKNGTPTPPVSKESCVERVVQTRARSVVHSFSTELSVSTEVMEALRARLDKERSPGLFHDQVPVTRGQMLAAAFELRQAHPVLERLSSKAVRALVKPFWRRRWTNADLLHGLTFRPSSWAPVDACPPDQVVWPAAWIRARLAAWRDEHGRILPGHSAHLAAHATARARHGRLGAAALPPGASGLVPEHVLDRARRLSPTTTEILRRHSPIPPTPTNDVLTPAAARAASDQLTARLIAQARTAHTPRTAAGATPPHRTLPWCGTCQYSSRHHRDGAACTRCHPTRGTGSYTTPDGTWVPYHNPLDDSVYHQPFPTEDGAKADTGGRTSGDLPDDQALTPEQRARARARYERHQRHPWLR
ncbi:hypothetical protein [Longimycelium tulufanense]|uniref:hypothetical protein n=1 Tax=Longimycelium tulufanense TaxID=907463 RepID=UPI001665833E|nr:hypothetical protein [Longimycelium tulufanense]